MTQTAGSGTTQFDGTVTATLGNIAVTSNVVEVNAGMDASAIALTASNLVDVGAMTLDANGGTIDIAGADIVIAAGATLQSTGGGASVTLRGDDVSDSIGIGSAATAATVDLSEAELQTVASSFSEIIVGSNAQSGTITVNDGGWFDRAEYVATAQRHGGRRDYQQRNRPEWRGKCWIVR